VAIGAAVDQLFGEPPLACHPVARYGSLMQVVEQHTYADRRGNGALFTFIGVGVGVSSGLVLRRLIGPTAATISATALCAAMPVGIRLRTAVSSKRHSLRRSTYGSAAPTATTVLSRTEARWVTDGRQCQPTLQQRCACGGTPRLSAE
jgi:cobalamin biosynthesis protein CobD/CbiB